MTITTSQTIGPFPHEGWRWAFDEATAGSLRITGRVLDGTGEPVVDAILEAWVPGVDGVGAPGPVDGLPGLRRVPTDERGEFTLALPARPSPGDPAAYVTVFARGMLKHQFTAVFLADEAALADASLLAQVREERRATLVAQADGPGYRWDVHLQGPQETVFFDYE